MRFWKKYILLNCLVLLLSGGVFAQLPVAKIVPENYKDFQNKYPFDLKTPEIFNSKFQYNPLTNRYELGSKIGDMDITTPYTLTFEEYYDYSLNKSVDSFYREKYSEEFQKKDSTANKDILSIFDFKFNLGPADKIFGPGGVQLKASGVF